MKNLKTDPGRILLIGIGNSGRSDDALGWRFAELIGQNSYPFIDMEYRYQLQIEDTELLNTYDTVLFADASETTLENGFEIRPCVAANHYFFSSHMQSPETLLYLSNQLYNKNPEVYIIEISGIDWELNTVMSEEAEKNLQAAYIHFQKEFLPTIKSLETA